MTVAQSLESAFSICGKVIRVEASEAALFDAACRFLSGFHFGEGAPDAADVVLHVDRDPPRSPLQGTTFSLPHGTAHHSPEQLRLEVCGSVVCTHSAKPSVVRVSFAEETRTRPGSMINVFSYAMQLVLRRLLLFDLHAAVVVSPAGTGVVIVGGSGAGKSTLTLNLIASGWRYLTDDMVVLDAARAPVAAQALRRLFALRRNEVAHLIDETSAAWGTPVLSDPTKNRLDAFSLFGDRFVPEIAPRRLLFPHLAAGASRLEPLGSDAAMVELLKASPWAVYDETTAGAHVRCLAALAAQCDSYRLVAGPDLLEPGAAAAFLEAKVAA